MKTAYDLVSFTELKADAPGVITAVGPGAGEVVQAGQMIFRVARRDGRDAVFDLPAQVIRTAPSDPRITVSSHGRSESDDNRPRSRDRASGRSGDADFRGQSRLERSASRDAAWRDGDGTHGG